MSVDVIIEEPRWDDAKLEEICGRAVSETLRHVGLASEDWEVAILGCNDARIAVLNSEFREKAQSTNVLSWPSEERGSSLEGARPDAPSGDAELGDLAIAFETCLREAEAAGLEMSDHTTHLIVHGTLHLLGYDHVRDGDGDLMEATETAILAKLGIADPYAPR